MIFAGIDPGVSGAIALINPDTRFLEVHDMPTRDVRQNGKNRKRVDPLALLDLLESCGDDPIRHLALEKVWGMQRDTPTTAFGLGEAFAIASTIALVAKVPHTLVAPQTWKREFALAGGGKEGKAAARDHAIRLLPDHADKFKAVSKDGRVDAALLAIYSARKLGGAAI
ncbi:MAG: hypothetical protein AAGC81_02205 [Pseudomonadota bacterium]